MSDTQFKRVPTTLLFNRNNGLFITAVGQPIQSFQYDHQKYIAREVLFSLKNDAVKGGIIVDGETEADDFEVVTKEELANVVYERTLNTETQAAITSDYPLVTQINIISDALAAIVGQTPKLSSHPDVKALMTMREFIKSHIVNNKERKAELVEAPHYVSDEQLAEQNANKMVGLVDPETIAKTTRVFKTD